MSCLPHHSHSSHPNILLSRLTLPPPKGFLGLGGQGTSSPCSQVGDAFRKPDREGQGACGWWLLQVSGWSTRHVSGLYPGKLGRGPGWEIIY